MSKVAKKTVLPITVRSLELASIETERTSVAEAEKALKNRKARLEGLEKDVITRLVAGAGVEGPWKATWGWVTGDCRPKWKDALKALATRMRLNADQEVAAVQSNTRVPQHRELTILVPGTLSET